MRTQPFITAIANRRTAAARQLLMNEISSLYTVSRGTGISSESFMHMGGPPNGFIVNEAERTSTVMPT